MRLTPIRRIAVFCGSSTGSDRTITDACSELAGRLCAKHIGMVYGGGNIGLMGVMADEMLKYGGEVIGVIPQKLVDIELAHNNLSQLHIVPGMHERKAKMAALSDAFVVLPGGIGTMEEFFEMYTWLQLGYHHKPVALLNISGFYDKLIGLLYHMVQEGFFQHERFEQLIVAGNPLELLEKILKS